MKDAQFRKKLVKYTVAPPDETVKKRFFEDLSTVQIRKSAPRFSLLRFMVSQLKTTRVSFWLFCAAYMAVVAVFASGSSYEQPVLLLCAATPFLIVSAIPVVFGNNMPPLLELESSCLYRPNRVMAARLLLCGIIDLTAVTAAGAFCAYFGSGDAVKTMMLGFLSFTASAFITLTVCVFSKAQSSLLINAGIFGALAALITVSDDAQLVIITASPAALLGALALFIVLLAFSVRLALRNYSFERIDMIGNKI